MAGRDVRLRGVVTRSATSGSLIAFPADGDRCRPCHTLAALCAPGRSFLSLHRSHWREQRVLDGAIDEAVHDR